jgi:hypothetical protein
LLPEQVTDLPPYNASSRCVRLSAYRQEAR